MEVVTETGKYVYFFGDGKAEGNGKMKNLLGGKGANLHEMDKIGMPVPAGFTITTDACTLYYANGEDLSPVVKAEIEAYLAELETTTGKKFGDATNPLLVSVRSGARASMPGMMDTILNLGLNPATVEALAKSSGNPRWAYDCYRRFIQMYADVVAEVSKKTFEGLISEMKQKRSVEQDVDLSADDLKELAEQFKAAYRKKVGADFPTEPKEQLFGAIKAVFRSWNNDRAIRYRRENTIPGSWGTAVNVQSMVFGNFGDDSGTGVAFTRDPATGEKCLYGEFLKNAQGEDVVAGIRTPQPIYQLEEEMPEVYAQFVKIAQTLEDNARWVQDMEFTVERGKLYMLQTRDGKVNPFAAVKIAVDLVAEGKLTEREALLKIEASAVDALLHPAFIEKALKAATAAGKGLGASPGAAVGAVYFTAEAAVEHATPEHPVILVRKETSPEDLAGMYAARGILTAVGGGTSHAAVVARGAGITCVVGTKGLVIDEEAKEFVLDGCVVHEGDVISIDGNTGNVYLTAIELAKEVEITGDFNTVMAWAKKYKRLGVRANADSPKDAAKAREFGAEGIGLCRTEHMFFGEKRILAFRAMILADTLEERKKALEVLLPFQKEDFIGIYEAMGGLPVTVRYLDPPLHEFLPKGTEEIAELAKTLGKTVAEIKAKISALSETNPMMGHRGLRLAVTYPEIAIMQTRALIGAAIEVAAKHPEWKNFVPEIMIPLTSDAKELAYVKKVVVETADALIRESIKVTKFENRETGLKGRAESQALTYKVGTMIETPAACLVADEVAKEAAFFSVGSNDLTQMTFGFSRDDAGKFLDEYYAKKIFESDPFARLDTKRVGKLIKMAVDDGRKAHPGLKIGVCGEHGGDPSSITFFNEAGLDYVSASPFRVPTAILAAAQATINYENEMREKYGDDVKFTYKTGATQ